MRRQNHSCDQCRKAKRACDAPSLRDTTARRGSTAATAEASRDTGAKPESGPHNDGSADAETIVPCSYCLKTNKRCTLNWARSQLQVAEAASASRAHDQHQQPRRAKRQRTEDRQPAQMFPSPSQSAASVHRASLSDVGDAAAVRAASVHVPIWDGNHHAAAAAAAAAAATFGSMSGLSSFSDFPANPAHYVSDVELAALGFHDATNTTTTAAATTTTHATSAAAMMGLPYASMSGHAPTGLAAPRQAYDHVPADHTAAAIWGMLPTPSDMDMAGHALMGISPQTCHSAISTGSGVEPSQADGADAKTTHRNHNSHNQNNMVLQPFTTGRRSSVFSMIPSPAGMEHSLATHANQQSISENLLQIYHDVLEHNMACWISEETCPYNTPARLRVKSIQANAAADPALHASSHSSSSSSSSSSAAAAAAAAAAAGAGLLASPPDQTTERRRWTMQIQKHQLGSNWTNRIYHRVIKLDKVAQAAGIIHLTPSENQASQKAFHLVIMAFATQWAQNSQRQRESYSSDFADMSSSVVEEFDRNMQRSLWEQARKALNDCIDIESYRVVCAEFIFAITQKPWEDGESVLTDEHIFLNPSPGGLNIGKARAAILSRLSAVLAKDGPPVFMERAARKMQALKYQFDNHVSGLGSSSGGDDHHPHYSHSHSHSHNHNPSHNHDQNHNHHSHSHHRHHNSSSAGHEPSSKVSQEESDTVALMFWLMAMCDTISSSLYERPVVLADENSQHVAAADDDNTSTQSAHERLMMMNGGRGGGGGGGGGGGSGSGGGGGGLSGGSGGGNGIGIGIGSGSGKRWSPRKRHNQRWRIDLFIQDNPERLSPSQCRWPCPYDEAAAAVLRSAPVKVILYRYVHYLQNMLRVPSQTVRGEPIEETIRDALLVYRYWNVTFGAFYRDLIEQYGSVPARIRGWSVCIVSHWHLAALMLADIIEVIDDHDLGLESAKCVRHNAHTVASIRKSSAGQLSDMARVATPGGGEYAADPFSGSTAEMPDFHFAVREGTILTEPWTMLLIRAFAKAAAIHLREVDELSSGSHPSDSSSTTGGGADLLSHEREACRDGLRRCEECIQALWFLGKKSDMARNVAVVLSRAMNL